MRRRLAMAALATALVVMAVAEGAVGAATAGPLGLRAGFSVSPGQWLVGVQGQATPADATVGVVPSIEAGFGDDAFSLAGQGDVVYRFPHTTGPRPYLGAGAAVVFLDPSHGDSKTNGGLNLVGGVVLDPQKSPRITFDGRFRLTDRLPKARVVAVFEF